MKKIACITAVALVAAIPGAALAVQGTVNLTAIVPVVCNVQFESGSMAADPSGLVQLGNVRELCNSSSGYRLMVDYQPGTLVGAQIQLGQQTIVLDGHGSAVLTNSPLPGNQTRPIAILPGQSGFDTSSFSLRVVPG